MNFDNLAVKKAINRMPGKALPSGTDFNTFLQYIRYELYLVRSSNSRKLLSWSAAKEAGTVFQTLDAPPGHDQVDYSIEHEKLGQQETEEDISQQDNKNEESRNTQHDILEDNNEEVGTTAPKENNEEVGTTSPKTSMRS